MAQSTKLLTLLRPQQVCEKFGGISIATLYRMIDEPDFPRRVRIGKRACGFIEREIDEYILSKQEEAVTQ